MDFLSKEQALESILRKKPELSELILEKSCTSKNVLEEEW